MMLVYNYQLSPGCCHCCRGSGAKKIIDTRREDPGVIMRANVYICDLCVTSMYQMLEPSKVLIESAKLAEMEGHLTAQADELLRMRAERDAWDTRIAQAITANADA